MISVCKIVLLFALYIQVIDSSGKLYIKFVSYNNPDHRLSNGRCCEQGIEPACRNKSSCVTCTLECDNLFKLNLFHNKMAYKEITTNVLGYKDMITFPNNLTKSINNPIIFPFAQYQGLFTLRISSFDDDQIGIDFVDSMYEVLDTQNLSIYKYSSLRPYEKTLRGNVSRTIVKIWATCDKHYYQTDCSIYCVAQNDTNGHFSCDKTTGSIVCLDGWKNVKRNCTEAQTITHTTVLPSLPTTVKSISFMSSTTVGLIHPTFSTIFPAATSAITQSNCTLTQKERFSMILKGNFREKDTTKFYKTFQNVICVEVNKKCFGFDTSCLTSSNQNGLSSASANQNGLSLDDVLLINKKINTSYFSVDVIVKIGVYKYKNDLTSCIQEAAYKSTLLYDLLDATSVDVCINKTICKYGTTNRHKLPKNTQKKGLNVRYIIIIIVVCVAMVAFVAIFLSYYIRKKRHMKIDIEKESLNALTREKYSTSDEKDTSKC